MFDIRITIVCPDLLAAAQLLRGAPADSVAQAAPTPVATPVPPTNTVAPAAPTPAVPAPSVAHVTPTPSVVAPAPNPAPVVPLSKGPAYSLAQIAKAGADLISQNPGVMPQVTALLTQYGVQAVTDVKPDDYGAFATALRGLGAKI